jgi:hypothetical protein
MTITLRVKTVRCKQPGIVSEELNKVCQVLQEAFVNKSLLFYDFSEADVWQDLAQSADYQQLFQLSYLEKNSPGELTLYLDSKLPDYRLIVEKDNTERESYILNQNSRLKKDYGQKSLFEIVYQGEEEIIDNNATALDEEYHQFFLLIKNNLDYYQINAKTLFWQNDDLLKLDLGKSWLVILDKSIDPEEVMKNLFLILADETVTQTIEDQGYLDMRFNLAVIRNDL